MDTLIKEDFTISIRGDIADDISKYYQKDDYSFMVENFFKLILPKKRNGKVETTSTGLRGCAAASGLVDKTDKEIRQLMFQEKYGI
jgi:hypothetical protein